MTELFDTVVLDLDGTLVDSNYHHVLAWQRAFQRVAIEDGVESELDGRCGRADLP